MLEKRLAWWMLPLVALAVVGCNSAVGNGGDWVGGACVTSADCDIQSVCRDDEDCLAGSRCVETDGGICVVECGSDAECRPAEAATDTTAAVPAYSCVELEVRGAGGTAMGCVFRE